MRVMLDTNILVSAFVFQSKKIYAVISYIVSHHELVLASYVVDELRNVVGRKFPKMTNELDEFLTTLSFTLVYSPRSVPSGIFEIRDIHDAPILYTAIIENVDVFITGDKDFEAVEVEAPVIMSVGEFEKQNMA